MIFTDGMTLVASSGVRMRVFAPRWWQIWRWLSWWRARRRGCTGLITLSTSFGPPFDVRVIEVK